VAVAAVGAAVGCTAAAPGEKWRAIMEAFTACQEAHECSEIPQASNWKKPKGKSSVYLRFIPHELHCQASSILHELVLYI